MSPSFAKCFAKKLVKLERPFLVATLMRETLLVDTKYFSCEVSRGEKDTLAS